MNTHLAACIGAVVWIIIGYYEEGKFRITYLLNGAFVGLAGITPASGVFEIQYVFIPIPIISFVAFKSIFK